MPNLDSCPQEEVKQLSDVRNLVNQLFEALNVGEHQLSKERELFSQLEKLKEQIAPLETVCCTPSLVLEHPLTNLHAVAK
jgi:calcium uniporter protein, mitochondrial